MTRSELAQSLTYEARDSAASAILELLMAADDDGQETSSVASQSAWYRGLDAASQAHVAAIAYRAADAAVYRAARHLDGQTVTRLHEELPVTDSTRATGEAVTHDPIERAEAPFQHLSATTEKARGLALAYYHAKPEMSKVFPDPDSAAFWRWVNVDALAAYSDMRACLPPVPPAALQNVVSSGGLLGFLDAGFASYEMLGRTLKSQGSAFEAAGRILDFGCGCGRVLRLLESETASASLSGCDVDGKAVTWCQDNLPWADAVTTSTSPPLPYEDESFDLIYSISVFSHLEERSHLAWIEELARITAPGALVLLTTHGPDALDAIVRDPARCGSVGLTPEHLEPATRALQESGFAFCKQNDIAQDADLYGMTFLTRAYVETNWTAKFEFVAHQPQALQGWQDLVVLRRRPNA